MPGLAVSRGLVAAFAALLALASAPASAESKLARLERRLDASQGAERLRVISAIGRTGDQAAVPLLLARFRFREEKPEVSAAIARALGELGAKPAVKRIVDAWDHLESIRLGGDVPAQLQQMRVALLQALGRLGGPETSELLVMALQDPYPPVAQAAARACGERREKRAVESLIAMAERGGPAAQAAYEALGEIGDGRAKPVVERALKSESVQVQAYAGYAAATMGSKAGRETLRFLSGKGQASREALLAAYYLARLRDDAGLERLVEALRERDGGLRELAVGYLAEAGNRRAVEPLAETLDAARDPAIRQLCVRALGRIGGPRAVFVLHRASRDPDPRVNAVARAVLADLGEYDDD